MITIDPSEARAARTKSRDEVWRIILAPKLASNFIASRADLVMNVGGLCVTFNNEKALNILRHGISSKVISPLSRYLEVGKGDLVLILDLDRTTAQRRAGKDLPLPLHSAENVLRLLELEEMANDTFESEEAALGWLRRPHPLLDGESPLESAKTSFGARRVKDILVAIKHGGVV